MGDMNVNVGNERQGSMQGPFGLGKRIAQELNETDYITINSRFKGALTQVKSYPSAECGLCCDYVPVVAIIRVKLKTAKKEKRLTRKESNHLNGVGMKMEYLTKMNTIY